jgi:anaerobic selenocysteine-containing dehydrogenase
MQKKYKSSCRMCHGGCGVIINRDNGKVTRVSGDPDNPINSGKICPKASASIEFLYHPDRILHPLKRLGKRGENKWERISWDDALNEMAETFHSIKVEFGSEYLAVLHGTSRPYVDLVGRFCSAFGTPNHTSISHICYGPRVMATAYTAGTLQAPMPDIHGQSGQFPACLLIWGNNTVDIGAAHGIYGMALRKAIKTAHHVIVVDPRRTSAAKEATHWLALRPGTDGALALAMLHIIVKKELFDRPFVEQYCSGFHKLVDHIRTYTPAWAAEITGLSVSQITTAANLYAQTKPASLVWGNAIDQGPGSFQTARALLILRGITGNLDQPGGDVFWETPEGFQSKSQFVNSELGGKLYLPLEKHQLAVDSLSCQKQMKRLHNFLLRSGFQAANFLIRTFYPRLIRKTLSKSLPDQLQTMARMKSSRYPLNPMLHLPFFWDSISSGDPYRIKAMWIIGANPLITHPNARLVAKALEKIKYLVASELFMTPTAQQVDLILPAATWLEQNDVVNQFKQWIIVARQKVAQIGEARDDREVILDLAHRLDLHFAFPWKTWQSFLDQILKDTGENFQSFCQKGFLLGSQRFRKYESIGFNTPSGKLEIFSSALDSLGLEPLPVYREPNRSPVSNPELAREYPLVLTTGAKLRQYFHSEYRQLPFLRQQRPDPKFEIHPQTAESYGIEDGARSVIETPEGSVEMFAKVTKDILPGIISADHGWWFPEEAPEFGLWRSNINVLFGQDGFDPETGSEPLRSTLCCVRPLDAL